MHPKAALCALRGAQLYLWMGDWRVISSHPPVRNRRMLGLGYPGPYSQWRVVELSYTVEDYGAPHPWGVIPDEVWDKLTEDLIDACFEGE